jgi:hypothetical protein
MALTNCTHHERADQHVVHALPGRVRLRFPACCARRGLRLASRLAVHPAVTRVIWRDPIHSLTVYFDADRPFSEVLDSLPQDGAAPELTIEETPSVNWGKVVVSCALSLLPLGPAGNLALTFVTALMEERRRVREITRPALPATPLA